jgi:hypothetical protein
MFEVVSVVDGFELFVDDFDELQLIITVVATAVKITNMRFIGFIFLFIKLIELYFINFPASKLKYF